MAGRFSLRGRFVHGVVGAPGVLEHVEDGCVVVDDGVITAFATNPQQVCEPPPCYVTAKSTLLDLQWFSFLARACVRSTSAWSGATICTCSQSILHPDSASREPKRSTFHPAQRKAALRTGAQIFEALKHVQPEAQHTMHPSELCCPGMIDTHVHAPQYQFTGTATDLPLMEWLQTYTFPAERRCSDVHLAGRICMLAPCLQFGRTTALYELHDWLKRGRCHCDVRSPNSL
mmetsp:Transcript_13787/g.41978  ORF Transcript_13787/g.41978 Transcript_13787/m.41978 type:complete len:231 (+) Transcript_13787:828-1520(+)